MGSPIFTTAPAGLANNLGITLNTVQHAQQHAHHLQLQLCLEYELPHQIVVSAGYVGSRGLFLPFNSVDQNMLDLGTIAHYALRCASYSTRVARYPTPGNAILPATNAFYGQSTVPQWMRSKNILSRQRRFGTGRRHLRVSCGETLNTARCRRKCRSA